MKKALIVTSVASMVDQFLIPSIQLLKELEYEVCVACNFEKGSTCSQDCIAELKVKLEELNVKYYQIDFARNVTQISENLLAYKQVKKLVSEKHYDLVHCHSPIGGLITRLACIKARKQGTRVIYTAHGFHFYKGAPKKNWLIFYPIEKFCSKLTDVIITINDEDYKCAKEKFFANKVVKIPGIGVDTDKFICAPNIVEKIEKRKEIGVPVDAITVLSVGELNDNKNHQLIMRALADLGDCNMHYVLAGIGPNLEKLKKLSYDLNIYDRIHFLGFRTDIVEINNCVDIFAFPSIREGLGMASLEALACGVPVIGMNTRGITEYVKDGITGFLFENNVESCVLAIKKAILLLNNNDLSYQCRCEAQKFSKNQTNLIMKEVYNL